MRPSLSRRERAGVRGRSRFSRSPTDYLSAMVASEREGIVLL
jgi:hypothetical protein